MEDGKILHLEFESDNITKDDLRRFRVYEAILSYQYKKMCIRDRVYGLHVIPDQRTDRFAEILKLGRAGHAKLLPQKLPGHMRAGYPVAGSSQTSLFLSGAAYLSHVMEQSGQKKLLSLPPGQCPKRFHAA